MTSGALVSAIESDAPRMLSISAQPTRILRKGRGGYEMRRGVVWCVVWCGVMKQGGTWAGGWAG